VSSLENKYDEIPSNWHEISLEELVTFQRGHDLPKKDRVPGKYPVVASNGIDGQHYAFKAKGPGVVLGRSGRLGIPQFIEIDYWPLNTTLYSIKFNNSDPKFVYYFLKTLDLGDFNSGSAVPTLNRNFIHPLRIIVPKSQREQERIGSILFSMDKEINYLQKQNEILEKIIQSIFKSWFVDFDGQTEFVDSELGQIPKGWKVKPLESILSEIEVGSRPKGGVSDIKTGIPSIGAESIVSVGIFDYSKTKYIPYEFFMKMKRGLVKSRDVLLYKDGGKPGNFEPHVTLVGDGFPFEKCVINEHVYRLRTNGQITQNFLYFWLSSQTLMNEMRMKGTGAAIPGLNSTQVKSLSVLVPDKESVLAFDINSEPLVATILSNSKMVRLLTILRDTLLPKLMSGKIRV